MFGSNGLFVAMNIFARSEIVLMGEGYGPLNPLRHQSRNSGDFHLLVGLLAFVLIRCLAVFFHSGLHCNKTIVVFINGLKTSFDGFETFGDL